MCIQRVSRFIEGADSVSLANAIRTAGAIDPIVVSDQARLATTLIDVLQDQDVLLMQGAGDIGRLAATLAQAETLEVLS